MIDEATGTSTNFSEAWLCKPFQVSATSASGLLPAIERNISPCFRLDQIDKLIETSRSVSSLSFLPLCDRASGNLGILRYWAWLVERLFRDHGVNNILIFPDVCGAHNHHRAKLCLKELRPHTMRHFSVANLYRLESVQCRILRRVEVLVSESVHRRIGPPQGNFVTLYAAIDLLFDFNAPHHKRGPKKENFSQRHSDLLALAEMVNGDLRQGWTHWCWQTSATRPGPCCSSHADCVDKTISAVANAMFGQSDAIPAESRWTSVLSNLKQTVMRRIVYNVGIASFDLVGDDSGPTEDGQLDVDAEAADSYFGWL